MHEASMYRWNCFLTLTYDEEHLPYGGELIPEDLQLFLKRLRRASDRGVSGIITSRNKPIRYFACGEYGEIAGRPHYHALLFNCSFSDAHRVGSNLFESKLMNELWKHGANRIGALSAASATYVAQYSVKKHSGPTVDCDGVVMQPPFLRMSLKPGIGHTWLDSYKGDLRHGYLVSAGGKQSRVPRAYVERLASTGEAEFADEIRYRAHARRVLVSTDRGQPERLVAAEVIHKSRAGVRSF